MESEPIGLRSELYKSKSGAEKTFLPYRSCHLLTMEFFFLNQPAIDLERFWNLSPMDERPFESFSVVMSKYCRTTSRRLSTGMHEAVENLRNVLTV